MTIKLSISHLSKDFGGLRALDDINLQLGDGEFVCCVGPSGCGKTTLLRILAGLELPDTGEVRLGGNVVRGPGLGRGMVFQGDSLLPWRSISRNISIGLEIQGRRSEADMSRVRQLIELVGLSGFERYLPWQLSGGMRQRANLARALAVNPEVLLMDEPFSALDAQTRDVMQGEILRVWKEHRKTVFFITHQIDEAVFLADRVVVMSRRPGRIREIIDNPLPRPRPLSIKRTPEFTALVDRIWNLIEYDVRESIREERHVESGGEDVEVA